MTLVNRIFFLSLMFVSPLVQAQSISGRLMSPPGTPVTLVRYEMHKIDTVMTAQLDVNSRFTMKLNPDIQSGLLQLQWPKGRLDIVFNQDKISFDMTSQGEPSIIHGEAWKDYLAKRKTLWSIRKKEKLLSEVAQTFPDDVGILSAIRNKRIEVSEEELRLKEELERANTLSSDLILADWNFIGRNPKYFEIPNFPASYFDNIDFTDSLLFYTPWCQDRIVKSFRHYMSSSQGPQGYKALQFTQLCMNKLEAGHPIYFTAVADFLKDGLENMNQVAALQYLAGRVADQESCTDPELKAKLENELSTYLRITPGKSPPALKDLEDEENNAINFQPSEGLYIFWSVSCSHCKEQLPQLYQEWKGSKQTTPMYSISLSGERPEWSQIVGEWNGWTNWRDPKGNDGAAINDYMVYATPTFVLVDKQGKIESVFRSSEEVIQVIFE